MGLPLKIGILSFRALDKRDGKNMITLRNAALQLGHKVRIYRNANFQIAYTDGKRQLFYKNQKFTPPDVMIIRAGIAENVDMEVTVVKQLQLMSIPVVNNYLSIVVAKNKVRTAQILQHEGIPIPRTVVLHDIKYIDHAVDQLSGFPVILKAPQGSMGMGVSIIESRRSLKSMLDLLAPNLRDSLIIIQEYVKEARGQDIRVFIVGGKIVAAMERQAKKGEFRSNFHLGGDVSVADLTEEEKFLAIKATKVIGLHMAGVDIIRTAEGPKILEVNSNPGLEGITKATGINVAEYIIKFAEKLVKQKKWLVQKEGLAAT